MTGHTPTTESGFSLFIAILFVWRFGMKLTRSMRKKVSRKLKSNWGKENLLTGAFKRLVRRQLYAKIKNAQSEEEVDKAIEEFTIEPLKPLINDLSNSTFLKSNKEFEALVDSFIQNPKDKYLKLRAKNMLGNKEDFKPFMEAFKHNISLIKDLPRSTAKGLKEAYMHGTSFRGTAFAQELTERLGKRAKVIIRTESAKITSTLTQARMQKLGLNAYIWSTSEDSRVRSAHALFDGVLFFWNDPPTIDNYQNHCGRFINCRCVPIPVTSIEDIQFPIKVARSVNIRTEWVKGGKGLIDVQFVSGGIYTYTKEKFIEEFGKEFF